MTPASIERACAAWEALKPEERTPDQAIRFGCRLRQPSPQTWLKPKTDDEIKTIIGERLAKFCDRLLAGNQNGAILGPSGRFKTTALSLIQRNIPRTMNKQKLTSMIRRYQGSAFSYVLQQMTEQRSLWVNVPAMAEAIRADGWGKGVPRLIELAKVRPVLLLDDLGADGKGAEDALYTIGNERCDRGLLTVFTSGLNMAELEDRYGQHIMRRLRERRANPPLICDLHTETTNG